VQAGLAIAASIGHRQWLAANHFGFGIIYFDLLAVDRAIESLQIGMSYSRQIASRHWIAIHTGVLAQAYLEIGQVEQAGQLLDGAGVLRQPPQAIGERVLSASRAQLAAARGDLPGALALVNELFDSLEPAAPDQPNHASSRLLLLRGGLYAALGRLDDAHADYETALAAAAAYGERPSLWRLHAAMARLLDTQARLPEADEQRAHGRQVIAALAEEVPEPDLRAVFLRGAERRLSAAPVSLTPGL
ncbi:MAG: hypothetical protein ABI847_11970, partial [Anaerolineales bacterium]